MVQAVSARIRMLVLGAATLIALALTPAIASAAPANDNFSAAEALPAAVPVSATGSNVDATEEVGEPDHAGVTSRAGSVWYTWTPAEDGIAVVDLCGSDFDTVLAVYTGNTLATLTEVAANDDDEIGACGTDRSAVEFDAEAGTTYRIAVDGYSTFWGPIVLDIDLATVHPDNDDFADAQVLTGAPLSITASNVGATREAGEPDNHPDEQGETSVWYRWTAPSTGTVILDLCASSFDTNVTVYTGSTLATLNEVGYNDDGVDACGSAQSYLTVPVSAGTAYRISIDGLAGDTGTIQLKLSMASVQRQTKITKKPPKSTTKRNATFKFKATPAAGAKFKCKLDKGKFKTCKSPKKYKKLKYGKHTFKVKAGGDPTPATYPWKIKKPRRH